MRQRRVLYSNLVQKMIEYPRINKDRLKNRLFNILKVVKSILDFLEATEIGRRPKETEEENTANRWLDK